MKSLERQIAEVLKKKGKTLAVAESCTGGLVSHRITNVSGSSRYFKGGIIAYSNEVKVSLLGVPEKVIKKHGAVSQQVARAMAEGARRALEADIAASVTGIAGPSGGTAKKPVGLGYVCVVSGKKRKTHKVFFKGSRQAIKSKFAEVVLELIKEEGSGLHK